MNSTCPSCGRPAYVGFDLVDCDNPSCLYFVEKVDITRDLDFALLLASAEPPPKPIPPDNGYPDELTLRKLPKIILKNPLEAQLKLEALTWNETVILCPSRVLYYEV